MASIRQLLLLGAVTSLVVASPFKLRKREALPSFATTYAPYAYLNSGESYWPSDIVTHLQNVVPEVNFSPIGATGSATLANLDTYNSSVYLTGSNNAISNTPSWVTSGYGKPGSTGDSAAPGLIIAVDLNSTTTDVFYFFFYSYNYGGKTLDINFDDHIGDWEHIMIRFNNGEPYAIYFSQHGAGSAYYWDVPNFNGERPITYIATGSHANYVKSGSEDYTVAGGIVTDNCNAGFYWDMTQNYRGYWYDVSSNEFSIAGGAGTGGSDEGSETASWLSFEGFWGDNQYPDSYSDQYCIFGECHYTGGPSGPVTKNLGRTTMCENSGTCTIFTSINDITKQS